MINAVLRQPNFWLASATCGVTAATQNAYPDDDMANAIPRFLTNHLLVIAVEGRSKPFCASIVITRTKTYRKTGSSVTNTATRIPQMAMRRIRWEPYRSTANPVSGAVNMPMNRTKVKSSEVATRLI